MFSIYFLRKSYSINELGGVALVIIVYQNLNLYDPPSTHGLNVISSVTEDFDWKFRLVDFYCLTPTPSFLDSTCIYTLHAVSSRAKGGLQ